MKAKFIILSFLFYYNLSQGQNVFCLKSSENNSPIKYAYIYVDNKITTYSDSLGIFKLNDNHLNSNIKIKALGYKTLDSLSLENRTKFFMEVEPFTLDSVFITQKKHLKNYKLGLIKNGNVGIVCTAEHNKISQVSKLFLNEFDKITYLDKLEFKALCSDKNRIISIVVYSVGKNGKPNTILHNNNLICYLKKGHKKYEIDLSHLNIIFPKNGVFIALNYIFLDQNKSYTNKKHNWFYYEPSLDAIKVKDYTDSWYYINNVWEKSKIYSLSMQLILTD
ncbi:hypothetical protein SAMN04488096_11027 [Mesonia phycicola]|uniref:CarboxypepD_reg-like domain-containing protein n=1 Tax=Mesonia phycicola TaxID=579105 RepID=A0A1M6HAX1_9FLAO|nr:hypothetical protein [Mesonia phycicola]SHJ19259.1 hypothetical protein SAMN04488096_11027 [Mesonia phycicola]